jgi:hypothetical protein
MNSRSAGIFALGFGAWVACTGEAPRPAATAPPASAAAGVVATAAAHAATSATLPPPTAAEVAPVAALAATPAPPAGAVLAREETKWKGIVAEVTEFRRKGNTLTAKVRFRNQGTVESQPDIYYSQCYLMDAAAGKKYEVLKDQNTNYIAGLRSGYTDRWYENIPPGGDMLIWMKFPAPPATVKAITLQLPGVPPFDDLAIQDN